MVRDTEERCTPTDPQGASKSPESTLFTAGPQCDIQIFLFKQGIDPHLSLLGDSIMERVVNPNDEFGSLTVLKEVEKDRYGHRQYEVRCKCGNVFTIRKGQLFHSSCRCKECATLEYHRQVVEKYVGTVMNGFEILSENGKNNRGAIVYKCRCLKCGSILLRTSGDLSARKGQGCEFCRPDYHFRVYGGAAIGILANGMEFRIDAHKIGPVSNLCWKEHDGYIVCSNRGKYYGVMLHQFVLGMTRNSKLIIDHINRNRADCRTENLRIVTRQQNSMNRSIQKNSTTGFIGVTSFRSGKRYTARIGLNYRYIVVHSSPDQIECAQAYNYASELLFGPYAGQRNDVPEASAEIKTEVYRRCMPLLNSAKLATTSMKINESA